MFLSNIGVFTIIINVNVEYFELEVMKIVLIKVIIEKK